MHTTSPRYNSVSTISGENSTILRVNWSRSSIHIVLDVNKLIGRAIVNDTLMELKELGLQAAIEATDEAALKFITPCTFPLAQRKEGFTIAVLRFDTGCFSWTCNSYEVSTAAGGWLERFKKCCPSGNWHESRQPFSLPALPTPYTMFHYAHLQIQVALQQAEGL